MRGCEVVLFSHDEQCWDLHVGKLSPSRPAAENTCDLRPGRVGARDLQVQVGKGWLADPKALRESAEAYFTGGRLALAPIVQSLLDIGFTHSAGGIGEYEAARPGRVLDGESKRGASSHRLSDEVGRLYLQMVEKRGEVVNEGLHAGAVGNVVAVSESPVRERDAAVVCGEVGDLLPPGEQVAAGSVAEDDGLALSVVLVVQFDSVDGGARHLEAPLLYWHSLDHTKIVYTTNVSCSVG